MTLKEEIR